MMGIANQDLVFKLKSIGVRVEGDDAHIDTDIISAILQGKKLPHPREVILRDEPAAPESPATARRRVPAAPPVRRPAANPLRPNRPRTLIQKVEPRIQTLPASERPAYLGAPGGPYPGSPGGLGAPLSAGGGFAAHAPGAGLGAAPGLTHAGAAAAAASHAHDSQAAHSAGHAGHGSHGSDTAAHTAHGHPASIAHAAPGALGAPGSSAAHGSPASHAAGAPARGAGPAARPLGGAHAPSGYAGADHGAARSAYAASAAGAAGAPGSGGRPSLSPVGARPAGAPGHVAARERVIETPPKQDKNKKKPGKGVKKPGLRSAEEEDLSAYKGTIEEDDIEGVEEAADGETALRVVHGGNDFDVMLTDYAMPTMVGTELARRVRARRPDLPIIMVTGYVDAIADMSSITLMLKKPFSPSELTAALQQCRGQ